ncbi:MAG: hypothetical protein II637_00940 [Bacteroidales bacterium]|nr:hypothetical protein [Bacteroidales bacterium]
MNKSIYIIGLSLLATVFSCNKAEEARPEETGDLVTISAILPEDIDVKGAGYKSTLSWTWSASDEIVVVGETTEVFKIKDGFTPKKAEFVGKEVKGSSFTIIYPGGNASKTDWSSQVQKGNGNLDHLRYEASLKGVDDYTTFSFSDEWATAHGGSIQQTGVLKLMITLPEEATAATAAIIAAEKPIFYAGNGEDLTDKITIQMEDVTFAAGSQLTAWATTSWNEATIPAGTILTVSVNTGEKVLSREIGFAKETVLKSGVVNTVTLGAEDWAEGSHYASGKGTAEKPWVIETVEQLLFIPDDLISGATRYFKLGADIDMKDVEWVPLNLDSPYDKGIDFDGNGHTISNFSNKAEKYPSFFGVLYGYVHDLNFADANIETSGKTAAGVVAGYCGTGDYTGKIKNVHVTGSVTSNGAYAGTGGLAGKGKGVSATEPAIEGCSFEGTITHNGGKNGVGGLIGIPDNMKISRSYFSGTITTNGNYVGGIAGYDASQIEISDCWVDGELSDRQRIGGIIGGIIKNGTAVRNCFCKASVSSTIALGGIVGHASLDKWSADTSEPENVIEGCIAWNKFIKTTLEISDEYKENGSSGVIVGYTSVKNYLKDCYRKADIDFQEVWTGNVPYDQENASPEAPLTEAKPQKYNFPYHGKAAAAEATISSVAQSLGWSSEIWDFSTETPKLK